MSSVPNDFPPVPYLYEPIVGPVEWNRRRIPLTEEQRKTFPTWEKLRMDVLRHRYLSEIGPDLTQTQNSLLDRIVSLQTWCEVQDHMLRDHGAIDAGEYAKNSAALQRLLAELAKTLKDKPAKTVDLTSYLARRVSNDRVIPPVPPVMGQTR